MIGPIRPPVRPSKGQSGMLQIIDHYVTEIMTAQPPGSDPSALQVATHGQQVATLGGVTPQQRCSWCILQLQPTGQTSISVIFKWSSNNSLEKKIIIKNSIQSFNITTTYFSV